jgi:hypothetical protein
MYLGFLPVFLRWGASLNKCPWRRKVVNAASPRREKMPKTIIFSTAFGDDSLFAYGNESSSSLKNEGVNMLLKPRLTNEDYFCDNPLCDNHHIEVSNNPSILHKITMDGFNRKQIVVKRYLFYDTHNALFFCEVCKKAIEMATRVAEWEAMFKDDY